MIGTVRTVYALALVGAATLLLAPVHYSALKLGFPRKTLVPLLWHRVAVKALGLSVRVRGELCRGRPLLIAANHVSWLDIMVLGSVAPVSFIAKSETSGWPFIGWLARMQRTVFIERERRRRAGDQASEIGARLAAGDGMVLFAEGTTADGNVILPFKSTLFGAAKAALETPGTERVLIQPVAIAYTRFHGMPMQRIHRPLVAWIGGADLVPQIRALVREGAVDVEVVFGEGFDFTGASHRKQAAALAERQVRQMHAAALRDVS